VNGNGIANQANLIFVGNNSTANGGSNPSSTTTDGTIAFAKLTMINNSTSGGSDTIGWNQIRGANGYRLQLNSVDLPTTIGMTKSVAAYFVPVSAKVTLAGTIKPLDSNPGNQITLQLDGTNTENYVTGAIKDASDYTSGSNTNAKPLNVVKSNTSTWTLSGTNTYSGTTTISGGRLVLAAGTCLSDTNRLLISTGAKLQIESGVKEKVGFLSLSGTNQVAGTYGSSLSSATTTNDAYFAGTGVLYVGMDIPAAGTFIILY
jgi:autotransporter-associated beta strand protein